MESTCSPGICADFLQVLLLHPTVKKKQQKKKKRIGGKIETLHFLWMCQCVKLFVFLCATAMNSRDLHRMCHACCLRRIKGKLEFPHHCLFTTHRQCWYNKSISCWAQVENSKKLKNKRRKRVIWKPKTLTQILFFGTAIHIESFSSNFFVLFKKTIL